LFGSLLDSRRVLPVFRKNASTVHFHASRAASDENPKYTIRSEVGLVVLDVGVQSNTMFIAGPET